MREPIPLTCRACAQYEDETLQALALSLIPEDQLREKARQSIAGAQQQGSGAAAGSAGEEDAFVRQLLAWFKRDFFTWVQCQAAITCSGQPPSGRDIRGVCKLSSLSHR